MVKRGFNGSSPECVSKVIARGSRSRDRLKVKSRNSARGRINWRVRPIGFDQGDEYGARNCTGESEGRGR